MIHPKLQVARIAAAFRMRTLRSRLVFGFSVLLGTMMFFVGLTLYLVERTSGWQRELRRVADAQEYIFADTSATRPPVVIVFNYAGDIFLESAFVEREMTPVQVQQLERLEDRAVNDNVFGQIDLGRNIGLFLYYIRRLSLGGSVRQGSGDAPGAARLDTISAEQLVERFETAGPVRSIMVGLPAQDLNLAPQRILSAMVLMAPLIIALSIVFGRVVVGQTLRPVDRIAREADAIRDGKSLHRRLDEPSYASEDELARLTTTINGMLARLETSFNSLRRFTADASHELKTPLTILKSGLERSITHPDTPPALLEILEESMGELNRMTDLTDSLLVLARADEGVARLHLEDVDLKEMLTDIAETGGLLGEQGNVHISVEVPEEKVMVTIDVSRVRQMLLNLLSNAVKYTPKGGRAELKCAVSDAAIGFTISDTGIGIAPGDLPHIFDRFWRIDPRSSTGRRPGSGLGLSITRWIAEAHGGSVVARSRPGRGSTFVVRLPRKIDV